MNKFDPLTALVTGAAARIGAALAHSLASEGMRVVAHCNRSRAEAKEVLAKLPNQELNHQLVQADFSDPAVGESIFSQTGPIDVLVNNASIFERRPLADETLDQAKRQFDVNLWAPLELMKAFKRQCAADGCVINMLDQRVAKVNAGGGSYPLSKKALADATLAAAVQWAPNIRVNAIAPGPVLPPRGMEDSKMKLELSGVPLARPVAIDDVVAACLFLIRNQSVTGHILYVDGGQHLTA